MKKLIKKTCLAMMLIASLFIATVSFAADAKAPELECTITDQLTADKNAGSPKDSFTKTTPMIYVVCSTSDLKKGQTVTGEWIAADVAAAPSKDYKIAESVVNIEKDVESGGNYTLTFSISKPTNGWPDGKYRIDLYVDNEQTAVKSIDFSVAKSE